jgi:hypothetical protein
MKTVVIASIMLFTGINGLAQTFDLDTLVYNGNSTKFINLVILGDGYTADELSKFVTDAGSFTTAFFGITPYADYQNYFNVFIIKVPSNESGASHPGTATDVQEPVFPVMNVDNYFGSTFDAYGIHRLLVPTKLFAVYGVLASNFPNYDEVLILVNSPYYGGSGGVFAVASTHALSAHIAIHEIGHSFAGLADEYWAGDIYAGEAVNMTQQTNPALVKWKNWLGTNAIGIYQHCCGGNSQLWYKPHLNCKMQYLDGSFCSVCIQTTIESIHQLITPIESYYPLDEILIPTNYPIEFKLTLIAPIPNTLKINWLLAGSSLQQNIDSVSINESNLVTGTNKLTATIEDTSQFLRVDNHSAIHISSVSWYINNNINGAIEITSSSSEFMIDVYPNPTSDMLHIKMDEAKGDIRFELYDMQGQKLLSQKNMHAISLQNLSQGTYIIKIYVDNDLVTTSKIIKE